MRLWDLHLPSTMLRLSTASEATFTAGAGLTLLPTNSASVVLRFDEAPDEPVHAMPADAATRGRVQHLRTRLIARVVERSDDVLVVQALIGPAQQSWATPLLIAVPDELVDDVRRRYGVSGTGCEAWLGELFSDEFGRCVMVTRPAGTALQFLGSRHTADVTVNGDRLKLARLAPRRQGDTDELTVCSGGITFVARLSADTARISAEQRAAIAALNERDGGLLVAYSRWLELQLTAVARQCLQPGLLPIVASLELQAAPELRLTSAAATAISELDDVPGFVIGERASVEGAIRTLSDAVEVAGVTDRSDALLSAFERLMAVTTGGLELGPRGTMLGRLGTVGRSLADPVAVVLDSGEVTQLKRRGSALRQARRASATVPLMPLALGLPVVAARKRPINPANRPEVRRALGGTPTPTQILALSVALNTPDVAVIQGPPGCGKTSLLRALRAVLQLREAREPGMPAVLLTSTQHDAVDNLAGGGSGSGRLPAARLGGRQGHDTSLAGGAHVRAWALDLASTLSAVSPGSSYLDALLRLQALLGVLYARGNEYLGQVAPEILQLVSGLLPAAEVAALRQAMTVAVKPATPQGNNVASSLRRLRTTSAEFEDDGAYQARRVVDILSRNDISVTEDEQQVLLAAASCPQGRATPTLLEQLAAVRSGLLSQVQASEVSGLDSAAEAAVVDTIASLRRKFDCEPATVEDAIAELAAALRDDVEGVAEAVMHYTDAFALTCQYSGSDAFSRKLTTASDVSGSVGTVVVDEAARTNPLDLLIPAQRAASRVILVGDQRQLPHLLEPESLALLTTAEQSYLRTPLFEQLFDALKERERRDGVPRTATLTEQFRMHPRLASFVSRSFYEPYDVTLQSPRPAEAFATDIAPFGAHIAHWVDLAPVEGREQKVGSSRARPVETDRIVALVEQVLRAESECTIGVISFYRAQAEAIERGFIEASVTDDTREVIPVLNPAELQDRLWIGTTDAAQGREFDIVFLSTVRSGEPVLGQPTQSLASDLRAYGHLTSAHRLCVAFSRARRVVIVVGDRRYLTSLHARAAAPALGTFADLVDEPADGNPRRSP